MFRNLSAEMARQGYTIGKLANALGITPGTLKSELTLRQAADIKRILQVDLPLEVLFERTTI